MAVVPVEGTLPVITAAFTVLVAVLVPVPAMPEAVAKVLLLVLSFHADERMVMASHNRAAGTQVPLLVV